MRLVAGLYPEPLRELTALPSLLAGLKRERVEKGRKRGER